MRAWASNVKGWRHHRHHAVFVGVQPVVRVDPYTLNLHCDISLPGAVLVGRHGDGSQCTNSNFKLGNVPHTAVYKYTRPAVLDCCGTQISAQQAAAQRPAAVNHQNGSSRASRGRGSP